MGKDAVEANAVSCLDAPLKVPAVHPEPTRSGWFAILPQVPEPRILQGQVTCDNLVVGGGWMGLHCARRLAELEPDSSVVLVDAGRIGDNSAGRCAGFAIDLAHNPRNRHFAEDTKNNKEEHYINLEGIDYIRQAVKEMGVECDWSPEGKYHSAATKNGVASLRKFACALDNIGQTYRWIEKAEIQSITGSKHYIKALHAPGTILLQPAKYMRNAMMALPDNCTVYEETPVVEVTYCTTKQNTSSYHLCKTPGGEIRPRRIFLCNSAYLTKFGFFDKTAIPLYTYASMTRQLTKEESEQLKARETFGVIPADSFGTTLRRTADNRLFFRNVYSYGRGFKSDMRDIETAKIKHQLAFDRRYPELSHIGYETSWGGLMTLSHNGGMVFGKLGNNVYGTAFCNGTGVARGAAFGKALAEHALGNRSRLIDILLARTPPNRHLPQFITEIGVRATTALRLYQAGEEV